MKRIKILIYFVETFIIFSISIITIMFAINYIKHLIGYIYYRENFEWMNHVFERVFYALLYSLFLALMEIGDNLECSRTMKYKSNNLDEINKDIKNILEGMHWKLTYASESKMIYKLPHVRTFRLTTNQIIVNYNDNIINFIGKRCHINDLTSKLDKQNFLDDV